MTHHHHEHRGIIAAMATLVFMFMLLAATVVLVRPSRGATVKQPPVKVLKVRPLTEQEYQMRQREEEFFRWLRSHRQRPATVQRAAA